MLELNIKDIAIIDAMPVYKCKKTVLNVGCGDGRMDFHLARMGYQVYATDMKRYEEWQDKQRISFHEASIFDMASFPIPSAPIVICSQVLEHLRDYKKALANLIELADTRLIITIPYGNSFNSRTHVNYWRDDSIQEFAELCKPYLMSLAKIVTKERDMRTGQRNYLIIIDKRQREA